MNDTQRLDFILDNGADVFENVYGKWICAINGLINGVGDTAREAVDAAAAKVEATGGIGHSKSVT